MVLIGRHADRQQGCLMAPEHSDKIALFIDGPNLYATA